MYVKTFASETLDEAFKQIKRELGPSAIILKTVTNKGIKGAFKKSKIEITAGITEKDYLKKARVDAVFTEEQKDQFYKEDASTVSQMIDDYDRNAIKEDEGKWKDKSKTKAKKINNDNRHEALRENSRPMEGYGKLGLNKVVSKKNGESYHGEEKEDGRREKLDEFLASVPSAPINSPQSKSLENNNDDNKRKEKEREREREKEKNLSDLTSSRTILAVAEKIDELEKKMWEITYFLNQVEKEESEIVRQWGMLLRGMGLETSFIQRLIKKALFELPEDDLSQMEQLMDFTMREMTQNIEIALPLFSSALIGEKSSITLIVSDNSCGQSSLIFKMGHMAKNAVILVYGQEMSKELAKDKKNVVPNLLNLEVKFTDQLSSLISYCREAENEGKHVFIDYRSVKGLDSFKLFRESLKKCFEHIEILVCFSALHSEIYNKNLIKKYSELSDGLVVSFLDACLDYVSIFNISLLSKKPLKFFSTGDSIPEDIEAATSERILARIFDL